MKNGVLVLALGVALIALLGSFLVSCQVRSLVRIVGAQTDEVDSLRDDVAAYGRARCNDREFSRRERAFLAEAWVANADRMTADVTAIWQKHDQRINALFVNGQFDRALLATLVQWANDLYRYMKKHPQRAPAVCP